MGHRTQELPFAIRLVQLALGLTGCCVGLWFMSTHVITLFDPATLVIFMTCFFLIATVPAALIEIIARLVVMSRRANYRLRFTGDARDGGTMPAQRRPPRAADN